MYAIWLSGAFSPSTPLAGWQEGHPACITEWWGAGVVFCLEWGADLIWPSWCHCHSLLLASIKSRLVLPCCYWFTWVVPETRAESVTENRNRYRDILKNRNWHRRRYWENQKKTKTDEKIPKKRNFGFCWWRFTNLKYIHFLPLTLRNEDCETPLPPVVSMLLCTVLENCRNSSSTSRNNECIAHHYCSSCCIS